MKCTFNQPEDDVCSRCIAGGYECVFPGRKPRAPGYVPIMLVSFISVQPPVLTNWRPPSVRMVLRQQIREKDAMIDNLLNRVNPGPTMATPLTLVPARLPLSAKERAEYRDVLTYLERAAQQAGQRFMGDGRTKFDISALEYVMSEDESESEEDAGGPGLGVVPEGLLSPKRAVSPRAEQAAGSQHHTQHQHQHQPMDSILEVGAPTGIMAIAALQHMGKNAKSVPDSASESSGSKESDAGVAGEAFFLPGESCAVRVAVSVFVAHGQRSMHPRRPASQPPAAPPDRRAPEPAGHPALRIGHARRRHRSVRDVRRPSPAPSHDSSRLHMHMHGRR